MCWRLISGLAALLLGACATAGTASPAKDLQLDDISSVLEPFRVAGALPGMAAAVVKGDTLVALGAAGVRKQGDPSPVGLEDAWHLGSDTKAMTATLVGIAVDEGRLAFDATLPTLFPGIPIDPGYANVTVEGLLQHRGGAPSSVPGPIWAELWEAESRPDALSKAVRAMLARPPAQAPGTYAYANAGYMMVGAALERIYGTTWESLITTRLFAPLGMRTCGFGAAGTATAVDQPWGHELKSQPTPVAPGPHADNPRGMGPAGTVHCSLRDWGKFLALHLAAERGEDRIVKAVTVKRLHTPPQGGEYAAGWVVVARPWAQGLTLSHSGSNTTNYAVTWLAPAKNVAFMVATNIAGENAAKFTDAAIGPLIETYAR